MSGDPLRRFAEEHRLALAALDQLEAAALALRHGVDRAANVVMMRELQRVLHIEVRSHNDAEERALFPLLEDQARVAVFAAEHRTLRELERALAGDLAGGDLSRIAHTALEIVGLLRGHIEREDQMLFPSARAALGPDGLAEVVRRLAP